MVWLLAMVTALVVFVVILAIAIVAVLNIAVDVVSVTARFCQGCGFGGPSTNRF